MGFKPVAAKNKEERSRFVALRNSLPKTLPEGWRPLFDEIRRVNDYSAPGVFAMCYRGHGLKVTFTSYPTSSSITAVHENDVPMAPRYIRRVLEAFWPGGGAEASLVAPNLVSVIVR